MRTAKRGKEIKQGCFVGYIQNCETQQQALTRFRHEQVIGTETDVDEVPRRNPSGIRIVVCELVICGKAKACRSHISAGTRRYGVVRRSEPIAAEKSSSRLLRTGQSEHIFQGSDTRHLATIVFPRQCRPWAVTPPLITYGCCLVEWIIRIRSKDVAKGRVEDQSPSLRTEVAQSPMCQAGVGGEAVDINGADPDAETIELVFSPQDREGDRCVQKDVELERIASEFPPIIAIDLNKPADSLLETNVELIAAAGLNRILTECAEDIRNSRGPRETG